MWNSWTLLFVHFVLTSRIGWFFVPNMHRDPLIIYHRVHLLITKCIVKENFKFLHPPACWARSCVSWGTRPSGTPMGVTIGPKLKIYVEVTRSEQFWFYEKKFGLLWFFWLCLVKNPHFWTILTKICFCSNDLHLLTKVVQK